MTNSWLQYAVIATGALMSVGCGSSSWRIVKAAKPNPFVGQRSFAVAPVSFDGLRVDGQPEALLMEALPRSGVEEWTREKQVLNSRYLDGVKKGVTAAGLCVGPLPATDNQFVLHPRLHYIETRGQVGPDRTVIRMTLTVTDPTGAVLDEVQLEDAAMFDPAFNPTVGGRLHGVAKILGKMTAEYLQQRVRR